MNESANKTPFSHTALFLVKINVLVYLITVTTKTILQNLQKKDSFSESYGISNCQ